MKVFKETAREAYWLLEQEGQKLFQTQIQHEEFYRVHYLRHQTAPLVLTDRTNVDHELFAALNDVELLDSWNTPPFEYDIVILFTTPIADSKRFEHYNDKVEQYNDFIRDRFGDKVVEFENYKQNEQEVDDLLTKTK